jgi:hypothetical protein
LRKVMPFAVTALFLLSLTAITVVFAHEENTKDITISKQEADITGDGKNEKIYLKAVPYHGETKATYFRKIYIEVSASNNKTYNFLLESGSKASLQPIDLNHDGVKDLFASVLTVGNGGIINNFLYSLKDFIHSNLTVPEPLEMESRFINGYKAEIKIVKTGETYLFNLMDREKYYKRLGLYNNGKLNEPMELTVNSYSTFKPSPLKEGKIGLKGKQRVTGAANADTIAYVESTWFFALGQWKLFNVKVQKDEGKN